MTVADNTPQHTMGRFDAILREPAEKRALHNQPLFECQDWLVVPTLGAIVPNWLIVLPRQPALCLRSWKGRYGKEPRDMVRTLSAHLDTYYDDLVWFEHGPSHTQSSIGCGTDYAHLHVLFYPTFSFASFARHIIRHSMLEWTTTHSDRVYEELPYEGSYLMAASGDVSVFVSQVECLGSQYFRRIVSLLSDRVGAWDYRRFPHMDNIKRTVENFRALETASKCCESSPFHRSSANSPSEPFGSVG